MLARRVVAFVLSWGPLLSAGVRAQDPQAEQTLMVLVTTAPGAPTADDLVNYFRSLQAAPPPLQGLSVGNPQWITYLLPVRAEGDSLAQIEAHPGSVRAQLERYVVVMYPAGTDVSAPLAALRADPYVAAAYPPLSSEFSTASSGNDSDSIFFPAATPQYGRDDLNIDAAWNLAGGYALVSDIDSGLRTTHPALAQFASDGHYIGGPFVPVASLDISLTGLVDPPQNSPDVDERRAMPVTDPACNPDPQNHPDMTPITAGHGTHVSGLVAANGNAGLGIQGTCKRCSIEMWKTARAVCVVSGGVGTVKLGSNYPAQVAALTLTGDVGASIANMSFGSPSHLPPTFCTSQPSDPMCLAIAHAAWRDIAMVASSGNERTVLNYPASDPRVIAAGGFQQNLAMWDLSPNCPGSPFSSECGSNYTVDPLNGAKQELVGSAQSVLSTTYPGYNWNSALECGDQFPGPGFGNGAGWCTGTSMSAPQISGVLGILRSINPLVAAGGSPSTAGSLRRVLASTTFEAQANLSWNQFTGYGRPDAAASVRKMLGLVGGAVARNRATPLFRLHSIGAHDYADTTSPQTAVALMVNTAYAWQPVSSLPLVPNYPGFPHDPADGVMGQPRASVYVLTTEYKPSAEWLALQPLYLMDRNVAGTHDFMLVTTTSDIEYAHSHGYDLRTIQGYIHQPCSPEPNCIPPGAQKFYRACNSTSGDCATFLESESAVFSAAGYTATFPPVGGTRALLGYAYPATDTDSDGLPDGFESTVGTSPTRADSDGDGLSDAFEYPMVGVPFSDPCAGGVGARYCGADVIFRNGFDFP